MPVYEYECQSCRKLIEIWQNLSDDPATSCPACKGPLKKIISMSSFQLKGGGWYADGYSSTPASGKSETNAGVPASDKSKSEAGAPVSSAKKACDSC